MADIKTRDAVKGTIKTIDKAAVASERMKSAYAGIKDKAEQGCYAEENSATEYATDRVSGSTKRVIKEGIYQFDKQGQKGVQTTKENVRLAKDKIADFRSKQAVKAAEKRQTHTTIEQMGTQMRQTVVQQPAVSVPQVEIPPNTVQQKIKTRQQVKKTIKTTARTGENAVKTTAKGTAKTTQRGIKTAQTTSKTVIKTTETSAKAVQTTVKTSVKTAQKTVKAAKTTAKATVTTIKTAVKATTVAVKAIIAETKALIAGIAAGGWIAVFLILMVVLFGGLLSIVGGGNSQTVEPVSQEVQAYEPLIRQYATQYGIPEYVELIKAVMMQESGGRGTDPMQAAEGAFNTRYPHTPNGIQDPEYSIECGVQELKAALVSAGVQSPVDMEHIKLALQGYNYGNRYIDWAIQKDGGYTTANAIEFSDIMAQQM